MPTQLQLEGPDLEAVLTRVRTELGPGARIVRAEKVRTGGIAGFFAKQRFEVTVEVGDEPAGTPAEPVEAPPEPLSLLDLADRVSDTESSGASRGPRLGTAGAGDADDKGNGPSFAAVLANLDQTTGSGPDTTPPPASEPPAGVVAPEPLPPGDQQDDADGEDTSSRSVAPVDQSPEGQSLSPQVSTQGRRFAALLANLDAATGGTSDTAPAVWSHPQEPGRSPAPRVPVAGQLARLGLPARLQPSGPDAQVRSALERALHALPTVPQPVDHAGAVLAVVGPAAHALEITRALARDLDLPALSGVALATSRATTTDVPEVQVLRDLQQAQARRELWRRSAHLTIVAIDAPMTAAGAVQARAFLSALQPSATWAAVESSRKPEDVGAFARAVGGVEALALTDVDETSDPAAVLELGIPIARLGGKPATPATWAALLTGRLVS